MEVWHRQLVKSLFHYSASYSRIEHAFLIKNRHIPEMLYKYREFNERHLDALERNTLWMSSAENLNDPFETASYTNVDDMLVPDLEPEEFVEAAKAGFETLPVSSAPRERVRSSEWIKKAARSILDDDDPKTPRLLAALQRYNREVSEPRMAADATEFHSANTGIISLSETPMSSLMWSYYSGGHQGFCIEYDFSCLTYSDLRRRLCFPVIYRRKLPNVTRYINAYDDDNLNVNFGLYLAIQKNVDWSHEREWRIVSTIGGEHANGEWKLPKPASVILGLRVSAERRELMLDYSQRAGVPVQRIRQRPRTYDLEVVPLDSE